MVPQASLGQVQISRLLCGSNPFVGCSYRSAAHDAWQKRVFTGERVAEILAKCLEVGINGVVANPTANFVEGLRLCERSTGKRPHWIAYACAEHDKPVGGIEIIQDNGAVACYVQGGTIDMCFSYNYVGGLDLSQPDRMDSVRFWLDDIRSRGMIAGFCTHHAHLIHLSEDRGYDPDFYVTPLNFVDVYCDYPTAVSAIHRTSKPVIAIKTLGGGGMVKPDKGLTCAYASLKASDFVTVGTENEEIAEYNARLATRLITMFGR